MYLDKYQTGLYTVKAVNQLELVYHHTDIQHRIVLLSATLPHNAVLDLSLVVCVRRVDNRQTAWSSYRDYYKQIQKRSQAAKAAWLSFFLHNRA